MKITAVKTYPLRHPLPRRAGPAPAYFSARESLFIKLETDEGVSGWGETGLFPGVRSIIEEHYAPILIGRDPVAHRPLWRALWGPNFGNGLALGGVDVALDDLRGKALGLSVPELYGGRLRDKIPAYVSAIGYIEGEDPVEQYKREATEAKELGFGAFKMRLGGFPHRKDLAAVEAVRTIVGPDFKIMADGNGAYTMGGAIKMGRELERLGLYWFEEPLPQCTPEYPGYEILTDTLDIPIAACEGLTSRGMFKEAIARRAMDIVQPDAVLCGGIGECLFVAEMARLWGILCIPHCWGSALSQAACVHLVSMLPDASWSRCTDAPMVELDISENPLRDKVVKQPLEVKNGFVTVPTAPGLGIEVDEERLKAYLRK